MTRAIRMMCGVTMALAMTAPTLAEAPQGQGQGRGGRGGRGTAPACTNLACDVQADWARSAQVLIATAEAMPEDKWDYKATPAQRSFGQHVMHIVQVDSKLFSGLGAKTPAPQINMGATSKADVIAALKQSMSRGEAIIKEFDDQGLLERVPGMFLGASASRVRIINFSMAHTQDVYGQLVVYLRLNGVIPPASNPA
jgi:uncharacterized damage-inducible protein DinB